MSPSGGPPADAEPARHGPNTPAASTEREERRGFLIAGGLFLGAIVVLVALTVVFSDATGDQRTTTTTVSCSSDDLECQAAQQSAERPGIIPRPGEGQTPDEPGDRGGWQQIAVFLALVAGLGLIIVLVVRSSRRARARQLRDDAGR